MKGAISFGVSDVLLVYDTFVSRLAYGNFWILFTYYMAQFGIAFSTVGTELNAEYRKLR